MFSGPFTWKKAPLWSGPCRGGLVEQHESGLHGQSASDRHPLLLAARELPWIGCRLVAQADLIQQPHRLLPQRFAVLAAHAHRRVAQIASTVM